jgi:hypothetical protein
LLVGPAGGVVLVLGVASASASADSIALLKDSNVWLTSPDGAKAYAVTSDGRRIAYWVFAFLTFDLEGRRSNRTGRGVKRFRWRCVAGSIFWRLSWRRPRRPGAQPVSLAMSWSVARAAELMALSHVARRMSECLAMAAMPWRASRVGCGYSTR